LDRAHARDPPRLIAPFRYHPAEHEQGGQYRGKVLQQPDREEVDDVPGHHRERKEA